MAMAIFARLSLTTLGDVLGELHRAQASGTLEIHDRTGTVHEIVLEDGLVRDVQSTVGPPLGERLGLPRYTRTEGLPSGTRIGEVLVDQGAISAQNLGQALDEQRRERLEHLFHLTDGALRFRPPLATRPRFAPSPLPVAEFLHGRPRRKARLLEAPRTLPALRVLGLEPNATREDIRQAFRRLALELHPDRHPAASEAKRSELRARFAELSRAYHRLTA